MSSPFAGAEMMTFFRAALEVACGLVAVCEDSRGLDDYFHALSGPRQVCGVAFRKDPDRPTVYLEVCASGGHVAGVHAVGAVVLEEVCVRGGVRQVVDRHDLQGVGVAFGNGPEDLSSDAPEAVYPYFGLAVHVTLFPLGPACLAVQ